MSAVPYTSVLDGQFRLARRLLDAGEPVPATLVVVGRENSMITLLPVLGTQEIAEQWFYERGRLSVSLHPRAACVVQDVASAALGLFGQPRAVVISYQDADGLRRAMAMPYEVAARRLLGVPSLPEMEWQPVAHLDEGDPRWRAADLTQFFRGATAAQQAIEHSKAPRRPAAWRFRR